MSRNHHAKHVLAAFLACSTALTAGLTSAQVGRTFLSLEWRIAQSDAIVRGTVENVTFKPLKDGRGWLTVTIGLRETIKGATSPKVEFATWSDGPQDELNQWKTSGQEMLGFLSNGKAEKAQLQEEAKGLPVPTEYVPAIGYYPIELARSRSERVLHSGHAVFLADLTVREKPEAILAAARKAVRQQGSKPPLRSHHVSISRALAEESGTSGDANSVIVPVDSQLESNAHRWIAAPGDVVDQLDKGQITDQRQRKELLSYARNEIREQGIRALIYFPSDENIALLEGLLNDPAWISQVSERDGVEVTNKVYLIRKAAYAVLKKWDVLVERPLISEPAQYDKTNAAAQPQLSTIASSDDWRTRIVQSNGLTLTAAVPATVAPGHLPLQLSLFNAGERVAQVGETGYCLDCKITLQTEDGRICKFTRLGDSIFGARENGGQYAFIRLRQDRARRWECELGDHFERLTPGNYRLTLEAKVEFRNNVSGEFSDTKTLIAKDLQFQVLEASKSR